MLETRDLYSDVDTLFVVQIISDAIRRGVRHFRVDGTSLDRIDDVVEALAADGEVLVDSNDSIEPRSH